jgi:hypothetical protein
LFIIYSNLLSHVPATPSPKAKLNRNPLETSEPIMSIRRALLVATLFLAPSMALAGESKIFLIDSSDGYGIDTCVASGSACGAAMAGAWCRAHDFKAAVSFGRVQSDAVATPISTGSTASSRPACYGNSCAEMVAITCE